MFFSLQFIAWCLVLPEVKALLYLKYLTKEKERKKEIFFFTHHFLFLWKHILTVCINVNCNHHKIYNTCIYITKYYVHSSHSMLTFSIICSKSCYMYQNTHYYLQFAVYLRILLFLYYGMTYNSFLWNDFG